MAPDSGGAAIQSPGKDKTAVFVKAVKGCYNK